MATNSLEEAKPKRTYEPDWSDELEGKAAVLGLTADAIGLYTALTGFGAPAGATIAAIGNIPNFIIDGYQTIRDWNRVIQDDGSISDALWNTGELALDALGAKLALKGSKAITDRTVINELMYRYEEELVKRNKKNWNFLKSIMTDEEVAAYISQKAMNAAVNSKHVHDAKVKAEEDKIKMSRIAAPLISAPSNIYHSLKEIAPQDNTRQDRQFVPLDFIINQTKK